MSLSDDLYRILGVNKDADDAEIKNGYRKKASKAHPDRGGDEEEFHLIRTAYMVLIDHDARRRYDDTGEVGDGLPPSTHQLAMAEIAGLFQHLLTANLANIEHIDIIGTMKENVRLAKKEQTQHIRKQQAKVRQFEKARKRLKRKKAMDADVLDNVIGTQIQGVKRNIESCEQKNEAFDLMIEILDEFYEYDFEEMMRITMSQFPDSPTGTGYR